MRKRSEVVVSVVRVQSGSVEYRYIDNVWSNGMEGSMPGVGGIKKSQYPGKYLDNMLVNP